MELIMTCFKQGKSIKLEIENLRTAKKTSDIIEIRAASMFHSFSYEIKCGEIVNIIYYFTV